MKLIKYLIIGLLFVQSCSSEVERAVTIIPQPNKIEIKKGEFVINSETKIIIDNDKQKEIVRFLNLKLKKSSGFELKIEKAKSSENSINFITDKSFTKEQYKLDVTANSINVYASSNAGFFYGIQTIFQLLPNNIESSSVKKFNLDIPAVVINDSPNFKYRCLHLDVSRHFFPVDEVKTLLDYMAMYKMNKFHWHLTDDQGWRIEIKKYPLLTEKGAWRKEDKHDKQCLELAKNDDSYIINPKCFKQIDGEVLYGGFYTQEQIKDIIKYAAERQIEVIPEIDIPGHFDAAISNYKFLACPIDNSEKAWNSFPACLGKETTYKFITDVLSEVADLFPSKYIHIGGDEVKTEAWKKCKLCQKKIKNNKLKGERELQSFFNIRIEKFLKSKGKVMIGWDEIVEGGATKDAVITWWRNWAPKMRDKAVNTGCDLIITPDFEYYFDFNYESTPVKKTYEYNPIPENFTKKQATKIIGIQANLWSERIPSLKRLQHQLFPRIGAIAESAWTNQVNKNFEDFNKRNIAELDRYDVMGINYFIPNLTGMNKTVVFVKNTKAVIGVPLKGMVVYYTLDGTLPTEKSSIYTKPLLIKKKCVLKARALRHSIWGAESSLSFDQQDYRASDKPKKTIQGVQRYVVKGLFVNPADIKKENAVAESIVNNINLAEYKDKHEFGFIFEGYIKIEKDGIYEFITTSDDGDMFYIGDQLVVDNGGTHAKRERSGMVVLKAGLHKFTHKYIERGGGVVLKIEIVEPNGSRRLIKDSNLFWDAKV